MLFGGIWSIDLRLSIQPCGAQNAATRPRSSSPGVCVPVALVFGLPSNEPRWQRRGATLQAVQAEAWATLTSKRKKGAPTSATLPLPVVPSPHLNNRFLMLTTYAFGGTRPARVCPKESTSPLGVAAALFCRGRLEAIPGVHVLDDFLRDRRTLCRDHAQLVEAGDEL